MVPKWRALSKLKGAIVAQTRHLSANRCTLQQRTETRDTSTGMILTYCQYLFGDNKCVRIPQYKAAHATLPRQRTRRRQQHRTLRV